MASIRKAIREEVVETLKAANTAVGQNVFPSRVRAAWDHDNELPCILVYTRTEPAEIDAESPRSYKRNLRIAVEILAKADDNLDNTLDDIAEQVESALFKDETRGNRCEDTILTDSELELLPDGDTLIGACRITFETPYYKDAPAAGEENETPVPFEGTNNEWDLGPEPDDQMEAEDEVDLEQEE